MTVRFGINPIGWTNDCMRWLGDLIPLDVCLAEARAAGFEGVELGRKFPRRASELGPLLDRHGLKLVSGWYSARLLERDAKAEITEFGVLVRDTAAATLHPWSRIVEVQIRYVHGSEPEPPPPPRDPGKRTP